MLLFGNIQKVFIVLIAIGTVKERDKSGRLLQSAHEIHIHGVLYLRVQVRDISGHLKSREASRDVELKIGHLFLGLCSVR